MDLTPINMQLAGYDYHGDTVAKSEASAPSGLNGHSQAIADAGKSLFPRKGHYHPSHYLNGKASRQVQALTERRKNASVAGMVEMSGQSHQPRLGVGHDITVEEALYGSEAYGAFMLTGGPPPVQFGRRLPEYLHRHSGRRSYAAASLG